MPTHTSMQAIARGASILKEEDSLAEMETDVKDKIEAMEVEHKDACVVGQDCLLVITFTNYICNLPSSSQHTMLIHITPRYLVYVHSNLRRLFVQRLTLSSQRLAHITCY